MRQEALSAVFNLAKQNPKIVFIGSDLGNGTLSQMKEQLPNQFFMEGISEQHIVGFAAGLLAGEQLGCHMPGLGVGEWVHRGSKQ
jgi:transketolase